MCRLVQAFYYNVGNGRAPHKAVIGKFHRNAAGALAYYQLTGNRIPQIAAFPVLFIRFCCRKCWQCVRNEILEFVTFVCTFSYFEQKFYGNKHKVISRCNFVLNNLFCISSARPWNPLSVSVLKVDASVKNNLTIMPSLLV
ncbi:uncharacterized protein [Anabrus simplex]|uniref:uncharacterized protein isoform X2 n=1 Tax=Anabrus simplex TaxID=316456 RepID=UPI0035A270A7